MTEKFPREIRKESGKTTEWVSDQLNMKTSIYLKRERNPLSFKPNELQQFCKLFKVRIEEVKLY